MFLGQFIKALLKSHSDLPYPGWGCKDFVPFVANLLPSGGFQCLVSWISATRRKDVSYFDSKVFLPHFCGVFGSFMWPILSFQMFPFLYALLSCLLQKFGYM